MKYKFVNCKVVKSKKIIKYFSLLIILTLIFLLGHSLCIANNETNEDYVTDLYNNTYSEIDNIDFSKLENLVNSLDDDYIFNSNFKDIVKNITEGKFDINVNNIFEYVIKLIFNNIRVLMPLFFIIIAIAILIRLLSIFSPNIFKDGINNIINLVAIGIVILLLSSIVTNVSKNIFQNIKIMQNIIDIIFPILLTLMMSTGATASVSIYTPITTIMNKGISTILTNLLYPIFIISFALIIVSYISKRVKLDKFITFLSSLFKNAITFVFVIFSGVFVIKGITAGNYDSISVYTTKFAVKNYIPIIGTYISEGFNYIMLSSVIVKNAIGLAGIVLIFTFVLSPLIYLLITKLFLHFTASIVDIVGSNDISNMIEKVSKIFAYPIAILLGVFFMFIMSISLVICTANLI